MSAVQRLNLLDPELHAVTVEHDGELIVAHQT